MLTFLGSVIAFIHSKSQVSTRLCNNGHNSNHKVMRNAPSWQLRGTLLYLFVFVFILILFFFCFLDMQWMADVSCNYITKSCQPFWLQYPKMSSGHKWCTAWQNFVTSHYKRDKQTISWPRKSETQSAARNF